MLDAGNLRLDDSSLLGDLGLLNSLSLDFILDKSDSFLGFLSDTRGLLLLEFSLIDLGNLGCSDSLLLLLSENFLSFLNKSSFLSSLVFLNGSSLDLNFGDELRSFNLEARAALSVSLLLSWVLRFLRQNARSLSFLLLVFSNNLLVLVDFFLLAILFSNDSLLFFNFSCESHLSIS
jgi:hypothetical protein